MSAEEHRPGARELVDGRYELDTPLGRGGMAQVWQACEVSTGRNVAVKFLRLDSEDLRRLDTRELRAELAVLYARFRREAELLSSLDHSGIPELYGHGLHRDMPYIAMRLVTGVTLRSFLDEHNTLPLAPAIAVAAQAAEALACAHTHPVVHRDLKPQNIMIDDEGVVTLIDFGIAKPLRADATRYTAHGSTLGSRGYQAPEQIMEKEPTARTDIYSFGCVVYELLAGRPPFPLGEDSGLIGKHLYEDPPPPGVYTAGVPEALDDLVLRMLDKVPERRPAIGEVLDVFAPFCPRPGDPEPRPRTHPDPTAPCRRPKDRSVASRPVAAAPPSPSSPGQDEWLDVRVVQQLCATAEQELYEGEPGEATRSLQGMTGRVRQEWGSRRPLVRRVWRLAADGLRLAGDFGAAAPLYQDIDSGLLHGEGPAERAERAVLRLRVAECRLAFGEMAAAIEAVQAAGHTAAGLPAPYATRVEDERRAVDEQITARLADPESTDL
ncbi:serine/threonine protein kinase [Streptomyces sp. NBC_01775]|uniref:serine/threonine-protein kinase n=1 Tax=Streptomyces sp. NBC_01775 TaxID=2975939 RepID=UPI002DD8D8AC|nr:serine/threonine-protein kinase [Streptomyces sp. NBC_01775]WSB75799.1 serine/threonine protein kinase [Streptomyces sp. NBC_01775]